MPCRKSDPLHQKLMNGQNQRPFWFACKNREPSSVSTGNMTCLLSLYWPSFQLSCWLQRPEGISIWVQRWKKTLICCAYKDSALLELKWLSTSFTKLYFCWWKSNDSGARNKVIAQHLSESAWISMGRRSVIFKNEILKRKLHRLNTSSHVSSPSNNYMVALVDAARLPFEEIL